MNDALPDRWERFGASDDLDWIEPPDAGVRHESGLEIVVWGRTVAFYGMELDPAPIADVLSMLSWLEARMP